MKEYNLFDKFLKPQTYYDKIICFSSVLYAIYNI